MIRVFLTLALVLAFGDVAWAAGGAGAYTGSLGASKGAAMLFWGIALATVGGSLFVITRRNLVTAVMGMVGTFFAIAVLYVMMYAHFMAAIQVLVYAGAIMVLFVFVIMILNREEEQPWAIEGLFGKAMACGALLYLVVRLAGVLWSVKDKAVANAEPVKALGWAGHEGNMYDWGTTSALGKTLFTEYLFPFEAISIVLLVAVIGAISVARPSVTQPGGPDDLGGAA